MRLLTILFFISSVKIYSQEIPELDTLTLNNGLKIYLLQYGEDPVLNIKLVVNGGKKNEAPCEVGYSEIIQRLLSESLNEKRNLVFKKETMVICETNGGQTIVNAKCLKSDFNKEMELLSKTISGLSFTKDKMDRIVSSIVDHYKPENLSSFNLSDIYRNFILYSSKKSLGRNYCQYQLEKVLPEELREFYNKNYLPKRSSLLICGKFNVTEVKKMIAKNFVIWRSTHKEESCEEDLELIPKIKSKEIAFINKHDSEYYVLKWVQSAPSFMSPDHPAFLIACDLFNRYLAEKIKENPKTIAFTSVFGTNAIAGVFTNSKSDFIEINCIAGQKEITEAVKLFDTTLQNFHKLKFNETDLEETIKKLKDNYIKINTPESILSFYDPLLYDFDSRINYLSNLSGIKLQDIQMAVKKYFIPGSYKLIIVGKEYLVSDQLNLLGNVTKYQTSEFETCDEACKEIVLIRCHCESCWKRGQYKIWRFNPNQKDAIKSAKAKTKSGLK